MKTSAFKIRVALNRQPANKQTYALDMYWKKLQKTDKWYIITPLTVVQASCYSDIEKRNANYKKLMVDLEKPWLNKR